MKAESSYPRRSFLGRIPAAVAGATALPGLLAQDSGSRPGQSPGVQVNNPFLRTPVSLIIDDSTTLVNLAHFAIPQFAEVFPDQYKQPWRTLPREIPDLFVRRFAEWSHEHGVKGKYSVVPYPACVGWIDRDLPGWSRRDLEQSLGLIREVILPDWDIHPEMISHTWAIDTRTGRPYPERTEQFMENWGFSVGKSTDELTEYLAYALRILQNAGLPCEGITTPGGFGSRVLPQLAQATLAACREVYQTEIPHYFRHLFTDDTSVAPRVEYASDLNGPDPRCVVSIVGCTGDWFGGWDGLSIGSADQFISEDLQSGRIIEVLRRREPAIMVCHWPGIYCNGDETGFEIFRAVVERLQQTSFPFVWMKLSEIARYWAARELTDISATSSQIILQAPYACPNLTLTFKARPTAPVQVSTRAGTQELARLNPGVELRPNSWRQQGEQVNLCFDLRRARNVIRWTT